MKSPAIKTKPLIEPRQARAKEMYSSLLMAAQLILSEEGIEALNSNAIVERAGASTPSFYRYFENKHAILAVLGDQLMEQQNEVVSDLLSKWGDEGINVDRLTKLLREILAATEAFKGGYALTMALRAIPELRSIRLDSHKRISNMLAKQAMKLSPQLSRKEAYDRCRLANELGYACVELLLETNECSRERIIGLTAKAIYSIF